MQDAINGGVQVEDLKMASYEELGFEDVGADLRPKSGLQFFFPRGYLSWCGGWTQKGRNNWVEKYVDFVFSDVTFASHVASKFSLCC